MYTYISDVSSLKDVEAVAKKIKEEVRKISAYEGKAHVEIQVGEPTILVNNAGVIKGKLLLDLSEDDIVE